MAQTVTFTKVFKAEGTSARGPWTRWDYKTDDGGRFPHFAGTQEIPLNQAVNVQTSAKGDIKSWALMTDTAVAAQAYGGAGQQPEPSNTPEAVRKPQGTVTEASPDWDAIGRGKTRCLLAAHMLPAMFASLDAKEQTPDGARVLLEWAFNYVYSES